MRNEKALGELGGAFMNEFVGLCPNKYLYLKNDVKEINIQSNIDPSFKITKLPLELPKQKRLSTFQRKEITVLIVKKFFVKNILQSLQIFKSDRCNLSTIKIEKLVLSSGVAREFKHLVVLKLLHIFQVTK